MYICPNCHTPLDRHAEVDSEIPEPTEGSVLICLYCATLSEVVDSKLIVPSASVIVDILGQEGIPEVLSRLKYSIKNNPDHPKPKPVGEV